MNTQINNQPTELKNLRKKIFVRAALVPVFISLFVLLPAGTFYFWQVYVYTAILFIPMLFVVAYFLKHDPEFLKSRMKMKERESQQKSIVLVTTIAFIAGFVIPGLDQRFGWTEVPFVLVVMADILIVISYIFIFRVFKENVFASRIIEVKKDQSVITTGPYRIIRHPMYSGVLVMYLSTPFALDSYWALIPFLVVPFMLLLRIRNEERILSEQLPGYKEYCLKVKFRLIPFLY